MTNYDFISKDSTESTDSTTNSTTTKNDSTTDFEKGGGSESVVEDSTKEDNRGFLGRGFEALRRLL